MASFETLLRRVRSETPISFFFVVSKVAFFGLGAPEPPWPPPAATAPPDLAPLSFRRLVIPCEDVCVSARRARQKSWVLCWWQEGARGVLLP